MMDDEWRTLLLSQQALTAAEETILSLRAELARLVAMVQAGHVHEPYASYCSSSGGCEIACDGCDATWTWEADND